MTPNQSKQDLADQDCTPCSGDADPIKGKELRDLMEQLPENWNVVNEHHLEREYAFDDFREALAFTNRVGELAEEQNHHPDIELGYGRVKITLFTHKIEGLSDADFVLAAKIARLDR